MEEPLPISLQDPPAEKEFGSILLRWADLCPSAKSIASPSEVDWGAVDCMMEAALPKLLADGEKLKVLLAKSRRLLQPLEEPFDFDLGLHRWLGGAREESYSDWLAWVVEQAKTTEQIFRLFGLGEPPAELTGCHESRVERERSVRYAHVDRTGRLDLVISLGNQAVIVVEVKTTDAESSYTEKNSDYFIWLEAQDVPRKYRVFLAISAEMEEYEGFRFLSWEYVAIESRRLAMDLSRRNRITTGALVLAFAASIEQNLLGYSAEFVQRVCDGHARLFHAAVVDHMDRFVHQREV